MSSERAGSKLAAYALAIHPDADVDEKAMLVTVLAVSTRDDVYALLAGRSG